MKYIEIYYNAILDMFNYLIELIDDVEQSGTIVETVLENILEYQLTIKKQKIEVKKCKSRQLKYTSISELCSIILSISQGLENEDLYYNFKVLESLINKINELLDDEDIQDIDVYQEEYNEQSLNLKVVTSSEYSGEEFNFVENEQEKLVVLNFDKCNDENGESIVQHINSLKILINILKKLDLKIDLKGSYCIITNINYQDNKDIFNYINMLKVYKGNTIYESKKSNYTINLINNNTFDSIEKYRQFKDVIYMLSEFNEENSILNKYLIAYQIIENFMFRVPICDLIDDTERMFTIRDFNMLYSKIDNNEKDAIKKFFNKALLEEDCNGKKLILLVKNYIENFKQDNESILQRIKTSIIDKKLVSEKELDNVKNLQDIESSQNCRTNLISVISKIVYRLRNSIVHNKATEFHLINSNLDDDLASFIDKLVIPVLIEIIFFLVINRCRCITYQSDKLCLYN